MRMNLELLVKIGGDRFYLILLIFTGDMRISLVIDAFCPNFYLKCHQIIIVAQHVPLL